MPHHIEAQVNRQANCDVVYDPIAFYDDPYPIYRQLRDRSPLYYNEQRDIWVLSRADDITAAASDWKTFSSGKGVSLDVGDFSLGPGDILDLDPPRHDQLRHLLRQDFLPSRLRQLESQVAEHVSRLVDSIVSRPKVDLARDFAQRLPLSMICLLLGVPSGDLDLFENWFVRLVERVPGQIAVPEDAWIAGAEMDEYLNIALADRRKAPRNDVFTTMAIAQSNGQMSREEVSGLTRILLVAGVHTTSTLISNSLLLLAPFPDKRRALVKEPTRIPVAIEELLRYESPVQWLGRTTTCDVHLYDARIPSGAKVALVWASGNRDERVFSDPGTLHLDRDVRHHMAFGHGLHFCIGAPLARLEARIAFEILFSRISEYEVSGEVQRRFTRHERGISSLPVSLSASQNSPWHN
jgi:cytochrome P450